MIQGIWQGFLKDIAGNATSSKPVELTPFPEDDEKARDNNTVIVISAVGAILLAVIIWQLLPKKKA